ncbi:hypothetical protein J6590_026970 [Homalodisca vitripennis]|nr:hypothetical protein J6590_026970 [Homalodisca vitripennis]
MLGVITVTLYVLSVTAGNGYSVARAATEYRILSIIRCTQECSNNRTIVSYKVSGTVPLVYQAMLGVIAVTLYVLSVTTGNVYSVARAATEYRILSIIRCAQECSNNRTIVSYKVSGTVSLVYQAMLGVITVTLYVLSVTAGNGYSVARAATEYRILSIIRCTQECSNNRTIVSYKVGGTVSLVYQAMLGVIAVTLYVLSVTAGNGYSVARAATEYRILSIIRCTQECSNNRTIVSYKVGGTVSLVYQAMLGVITVTLYVLSVTAGNGYSVARAATEYRILSIIRCAQECSNNRTIVSYKVSGTVSLVYQAMLGVITVTLYVLSVTAGNGYSVARAATEYRILSIIRCTQECSNNRTIVSYKVGGTVSLVYQAMLGVIAVTLYVLSVTAGNGYSVARAATEYRILSIIRCTQECSNNRTIVSYKVGGTVSLVYQAMLGVITVTLYVLSVTAGNGYSVARAATEYRILSIIRCTQECSNNRTIVSYKVGGTVSLVYQAMLGVITVTLYVLSVTAGNGYSVARAATEYRILSIIRCTQECSNNRTIVSYKVGGTVSLVYQAMLGVITVTLYVLSVTAGNGYSVARAATEYRILSIIRCAQECSNNRTIVSYKVSGTVSLVYQAMLGVITVTLYVLSVTAGNGYSVARAATEYRILSIIRCTQECSNNRTIVSYKVGGTVSLVYQAMLGVIAVTLYVLSVTAGNGYSVARAATEYRILSIIRCTQECSNNRTIVSYKVSGTVSLVYQAMLGVIAVTLYVLSVTAGNGYSVARAATEYRILSTIRCTQECSNNRTIVSYKVGGTVSLVYQAMLGVIAVTLYVLSVTAGNGYSVARAATEYRILSTIRYTQECSNNRNIVSYKWPVRDIPLWVPVYLADNREFSVKCTKLNSVFIRREAREGESL